MFAADLQANATEDDKVQQEQKENTEDALDCNLFRLSLDFKSSFCIWGVWEWRWMTCWKLRGIGWIWNCPEPAESLSQETTQVKAVAGEDEEFGMDI